MKKVFFFLLIPIFGLTQVQIGKDIDGEASLDFFGFSTSISSDGKIVAIGAPFNDGNGNDAGHVRIFEDKGQMWVQIGEDLDGEAEGDNMGRSVSMSGNGNIVAIGGERNDENGLRTGHVRVLENQNGTWVQIGEDIDGETIGDLSGTSVSLSDDGNIVAIGAPGNDGGHVRVFRNEGGSWIKIGENIEGESRFDLFGGSISISADGNVIAIGAEFNSGNGSQAGHVRIYENQNDEWVQVGEDLEGILASDFFGKALSLSADGQIVAIRSGGSTSSITDAGYVQVYENQGGNWLQIGENIEGEAPGDIFLSSPSDNIALSGDGRILAIGARHNDGNGESSGHVRVFVNKENSWVQIGEDIDGQAAGDLSGHSVSISDDGYIVAIGARDNGGTGSSAGHVRVFDMSDLISSTINPKRFGFSIYPNPSTTEITITLDQENIFEQVSIYNSLGQKMLASKNKTILTSYLPKGIYVVEVGTSKGRATQKLIIH